MKIKRSCTSNRGAVAAMLLAASAATPALAQTSYFSFQGNLVTNADKEDFGINFNRAISNTETFGPLRFQTYSRNSGTNAAGEVITGNVLGIDSVLQLFDSANASHGFNDDQVSGSNLDSLITWSQGNGTALNPNPLTAGAYRLNLIAFNNNGTGAWTTDLVGPADALSMTSVTPTGTSTISSLKFGTTDAGANIATFNSAGTLNIAGTLGVGAKGNGTMNVTGGTTTVGGVTTINAGGLLNLSSTFNANGNIVIDGGKLAASASLFGLHLASSKTLTASTGGQVSFGGAYGIANGTSFTIQSGSSLSTASNLDIGSTTNGTLTVTGSGSTLNVATGNLFGTPNWGAAGGTANVTISSQANATINGVALFIGSSTTAGTNGTVNVNTAATMGLNGLSIADQSAGTGTLTVNGASSSVTQSGASALTVGAPTGATGTGTLNIQSSGTFTSGTGAIAIQKTGSVNLTGGTFNANGDITLDGGKLLHSSGTFNLAAGKNLTASNSAQVSFGSLYNIGGNSTFTIQSGSTLTTSASDLTVGQVNGGGNGTLLVTGLGTTLTSTHLGAGVVTLWGQNGNTVSVTISDQAVATLNYDGLGLAQSSISATNTTLNVTSAASFTTTQLVVAAGNAGTATVNVTGTNSTLTATGTNNLSLNVGASGTSTSIANINVQSSGVLNATGATLINKTGTLNISGGTFNANAGVTLDGGKLIRTSGAFNLAAGKNITANNSAQVSLNSGYEVPSGSTFTIQTGSTFTVGNFLDIAPISGNGAGTVVVDGLHSALNFAGNSFWGADAFAANVTIRNQATMTGGGILLANGSPSTGSGTFNIQSAAQVTIDSLDVGTSNGTGVVNVTGTSSKLVQTGDSNLNVGRSSSPTGTGTINIQNGGTFLAGTGLTTISTTGKIDNSSGTFTAAAVSNNGILNSASTTTTGAITGGGTTNVSFGTLTATGGIQQGTLLISNAGKAVVTASTPATGGRNASISALTTLTISNNGAPLGSRIYSGTLDLKNNDLILQTGGLANITDELRSGLNTGIGYWNGTGIDSSTAAADTTRLTVLGVMQNNQSGAALFTAGHPFDGLTPGVSDLLVKYTYYGDTNLDGKTDGTDYTRIDSAFLADKTNPTSATGWFNGDFNYDGATNGSDYTLIDNAFNAQGASLTSLIASPGAVTTAEMPATSIPEPAGGGMIAVVASSLLGCRRSRGHGNRGI